MRRVPDNISDMTFPCTGTLFRWLVVTQQARVQMVDLTYVVAARRLQEAGQLGAARVDFTPAADRDRMINARVRRTLRDADGDVQAVLRAQREELGAPGHLGHLLESLPTAEDAVDISHSARAPCSLC